MKRRIAKTLALLLTLCMLIPQTVLAATTYYIDVEITGPDAAGVSERGLYYRLDRAVLTAAFPLGVSNSFTGEAAEISVGRGTLIVYWQDDPALPLPERGKI